MKARLGPSFEVDGDRFQSVQMPEVSIPVNALLSPDSDFYKQPWPEVITRTLDVLAPHMREIQRSKKRVVIRANAPPFKIVINASGRDVKLDGEVYVNGEMAFLRDGGKAAAINMLAGPHAQLLILAQVEPVSASHGIEISRQIEDEIIEALKAEAARAA